MPEPLLPVAISARSSSEEDKLVQGLARLQAEDPTVRVEVNPATEQLLMWTMGEQHLEVLLDRLRTRAGIDVVVESGPGRGAGDGPRQPPNGLGRHVKQSGGHGQYAVAQIEVEPLPQGGGFEFVDRVVGGAVPRQYIPSVEKGIRTQLERGVERPPDGRSAGDPGRRQGAQRRFLRRRLPDGRIPCPAGGLARGRGAAARTDGLGDDHRRRRVRRRGARRSRVPRGTGARHGARPRQDAPPCWPRFPRWSSPATPSICARSRTAPAPSAGSTCGTRRRPITSCRD